MALNPRGAGRGSDATAAAVSQAQPADRRTSVGDDEDIQFFEGTIVKIDAQGREVMSDHLAPGETLRRDTTDKYTAVRDTSKRDAGKDEDTSPRKDDDK